MNFYRQACMILALAALPAAPQVTTADLRSAPNENCLTYIGDYSAHRFSSLTQINRDNVAKLAPKWVRHIDGANELETVPLVYDGVMYATNSNEVYALDAVDGKEIWHYRAEGARRRSASRGAAILGDRVYLVTSDCHMIALRRSSGGFLWD